MTNSPVAAERRVACKEFPEFRKDIWAVAAPRDASEEALQDNYDLYLSLQDPATGRPVAHGHFEGLLSNGGGPLLSAIEIDTASYLLAPGIRAFGVRALNSMTMFGVPTDGEELALFVVKGRHLLNVLPRADMRVSYSDRGDACQEHRREVTRVLVVDNSFTNGFHDLLVKETITDLAGRKEASGRCQIEPTDVTTGEHRLKYDGSKYIIPRDMQEVDCKVC